MKNCTICEKNFKGARKSAQNEKGEYYFICPGCSQVYLVTTVDGLPVIKKTKNGAEAKDQMIEAKKLLEKSKVNIAAFKDDIHSEFKSSEELEEKVEVTEKEITITEEDREFINETQVMMSILSGKTIPMEDMDRMFLDIKKKHLSDESPIRNVMDSLIETLEGMFSNNDAEQDEAEDDQDDCKSCKCNECSSNNDCEEGCKPCAEESMMNLGDLISSVMSGEALKKNPDNTTPKKEAIVKSNTSNSIKEYKYLIEINTGENDYSITRAKDDKDLIKVLERLEKDNITVSHIMKIEKVEVEKVSSFKIL